MAVLIAIFDVRLTMIAGVSAGTFDAVVKAATLNVVPAVGGAIPIVAVLAEGCGLSS
jgi:hypothetical protein